jgi:hypothetical protein
MLVAFGLQYLQAFMTGEIDGYMLIATRSALSHPVS